MAARSAELRRLAERIAEGLPPIAEEVVLTGSVPPLVVNRVWPPTDKRVSTRVEGLAVKPERLAERIEEALAEPDPFRALLVLNHLQLETVALAPSGPNVDRARRWLAEVAEVLRKVAEP